MKEGLNKQDITNLLEMKPILLNLIDNRVSVHNDFMLGQQLQLLQLKRESNLLRTERDNFDGISPL
jgi:hypothetical protein